MLLHIRAEYDKLSSPVHLTAEMAQIIDIDSYSAGAASPNTEDSSAVSTEGDVTAVNVLPITRPSRVASKHDTVTGSSCRNRSSFDSAGESLRAFDDESSNCDASSSVSPSAYTWCDLESFRSAYSTGSCESGVLDSEVFSFRIDSEIEEISITDAYDKRTFVSISHSQGYIINEN